MQNVHHLYLTLQSFRKRGGGKYDIILPKPSTTGWPEEKELLSLLEVSTGVRKRTKEVSTWDSPNKGKPRKRSREEKLTEDSVEHLDRNFSFQGFQGPNIGPPDVISSHKIHALATIDGNMDSDKSAIFSQSASGAASPWLLIGIDSCANVCTVRHRSHLTNNSS